MICIQRKDLSLLGILFLVVLVIFYPVLFTEYIYTDEAAQLWFYRPGSSFNMFGGQGRWITELLVSKSFAAIDTVHEITYIRICSLCMWLVAVPVWYITAKRLVAKTPGYEYLPFFICLYLVTSLQFSIGVQWASCVELAIANTAGLVSGAIWYLAIRDKETKSIPVGAAISAAVAGLISLFSYQSGFPCFLIPFLFHYICVDTKRKDALLIKGLIFYFFMYALYFVLFKCSLAVAHMTSDERTGFTNDLIKKVLFFLSQPLKRAFWFNIIADNESNLAKGVYGLLLAGWMALAFVRFGKKNRQEAIKYIAAVWMLFVLAYLPNLVVKENYASNRTMLAIDMCVWIVCVDMARYFLKNGLARKITAVGIVTVLLVAGWYNFNQQFLMPVAKEYKTVKSYVQQHYNKNITTVYFIKPTEDAFKKRYQLQLSMDEFGVPSTFFEWVPELLMKQLVFEITGNRTTADQLVVKHWPDMKSFSGSGESLTGNVLMVNIPALISAE